MSSGPGQIVVVGRAQESEAVRQDFEHAFREDEAALFGLRLQDLKNQLLLAHAGRAGHAHVLRDLRELLDAHVLQIGDVQSFAGTSGRRRGLGRVLRRLGCYRCFRRGGIRSRFAPARGACGCLA